MKIVLTGAAGKLGHMCTRVLSNHRHKVTPTDLTYRTCLTLPKQIEVLDLCKRESIYRLLEGQQGLVHLANLPASVAMRDPLAAYHRNTQMNANVFQAALEMKLKCLIFASTSMVISGSRVSGDQGKSSALKSLPIDGTEQARPGSLYAESKAAGEQLLKYYADQHGMTCISIRFPVLVERSMVEQIKKERMDEPLPGLTMDDGFGYLTFDDAADLIGTLLNAKLTAGYYCLHPAAEGNYLNQSASDVAQRFYPDVPWRDGVKHLEHLVDPRPLESLLKWKPKFC